MFENEQRSHERNGLLRLTPIVVALGPFMTSPTPKLYVYPRTLPLAKQADQNQNF